MAEVARLVGMEVRSYMKDGQKMQYGCLRKLHAT